MPFARTHDACLDPNYLFFCRIFFPTTNEINVSADFQNSYVKIDVCMACRGENDKNVRVLLPSDVDSERLNCSGFRFENV